MPSDEMTPAQRRTLNARITRRRAADDRVAEDLRKRGWLVVRPEYRGWWREVPYYDASKDPYQNGQIAAYWGFPQTDPDTGER